MAKFTYGDSERNLMSVEIILMIMNLKRSIALAI